MEYIITNGIKVVGPFKTFSEASKYIEAGDMFDWYIKPLILPNKFDPFGDPKTV